MTKLGVYVCTYANPVFLRHCLLQILHQSRRPDILAVHENANTKSYKHLVQDVLDSLEVKGVDVIYQHTPHKLPMPEFFAVPLQALLDAGCDLFNKVDHDDLLFEHHFETQIGLMFNPQLQQPDYSYAMNSNSGLLVLSNKGGYRHKPSVDFGIWNPTGAHPNSIIFDRAVAQEFVKEMGVPRGLNDDAVLAQFVLPKFKGNKVARQATSCFVAHGRNVSVSHWSDIPPLEVC